MTILRRFTSSDSRIPRMALAICLAALFNPAAFAGVNRWTMIGPPAPIVAMAVDPQNDNILYAVGERTVARSDDRGATWTLTPVPDLLGPTAIRVAASLPSTVYVLGFTDVYRSTTAGFSWTSQSGPSIGSPRDLQVDERNSAVIFVASANFCFFGCSGGGVFRSDNGGNSWRRIGLKDTDVYEIALAPESSQVVYASTRHELLKTTNGGSSWNEISPPGGGDIHSIAVDLDLSSTVYAGTDLGIFKSLDSGHSWELIRAGEGSLLIADQSGPNNLLVATGRLARSFDGGQTWQEFSVGIPGAIFNSLGQIVVSRDTVYMVATLHMASDLHVFQGQILEYETLRPRRRAASP